MDWGRQGQAGKCNLFGIKWPSSIKYLGVYLGHNKEGNLKSNWDEKKQHIKQTLNCNIKTLNVCIKYTCMKKLANDIKTLKL